MKKTALVLVIAAIAAASTAQAEENVNIGLPAPRVVVSVPPAVIFDVAPHFIAPSRLGFYVGVDTPYDIFLITDVYYMYNGNRWLRDRHHNGHGLKSPAGSCRRVSAGTASSRYAHTATRSIASIVPTGISTAGVNSSPTMNERKS